MRTEEEKAQTRFLIVICIIALLGVAALSVYSYTVTTSLSQQNTSLSREVSDLNSNLSSLENALEEREVQAGLNYLASNYNPHVGLISESPHSDVYWLYSDNFLAALAINSTRLSNSTLTAIGDNISKTLARYPPMQQTLCTVLCVGNATNQYVLLSTYWKGSCYLKSAEDYTAGHFGDIEVMATLNNGSGTLSETRYADIAFLQAVCNLRQGNVTGWSQGFGDGLGFYNGVGFNDTPFQEGSSKGIYQTYKLTLFIYAMESQCGPFNQTAYQSALTTLLQMQAPDGGFHTGYNPDLSINGTTNTETTSLAILAMSTVTYCFS